MRNQPSINIEEYLSRISLFEGLAKEEIAKIARGTHEVYAAKGDVVFHKGDTCTGFHIVVEGQIKLAFTSPQGNEKVVEVVQRGQSFGEAVMFAEKPYPVFAQALSDCQILHVSKATLFEEIECDFRVAKKMLASMAMRLHQTISDVESYSLLSGKQRVIGYLLRELSDEQMNATDVLLELPVTKGVIASRLNLTQEHFSRILHELADRGLIIVDGKRILINDVGKLKAHQI